MMEHDSHDNHPYRERVHSTVRLAALIVRPRAAAGGVMEVLRGTLVRQRGVRNVLNVVLKSSTAAGWSVEEAGASTAEADAAKVLLFDQAFMKAEDVPSGPLTFITLAQMSSATTCPAQLREKLAQPEKNAAAGSSKRAAPWSADAVEVALSTHTVELTYKNYTMPELLQLVLPREVEMPAKTNTKTRASTGASSSSPQTTTNNNNTSTTTKALVALSGFEQVGHIAHVNLSDAHVPYQGTIGQVILDCNPSVDVVVNKVESISSVFREFKMEVIAQRHTIPRPPKDEACEASSTAAHEDQKSLEEQQRDELLTATVRQHGCMFRVPYNRVYWNSRLSHEHTRLVELLREGDVLFDVMAGVGPFSVPAAKNGHQVFANDLNPAAAEAMRRNCLLNKIDPMRLMVYNMDGRCFLNQTVYDHVMGLQVGQQKGVYECRGRRHVVLNLPAIAVEFLDVFSPAYARTTPDGRSPWTTRPPEASQVDRSFLIHVYCFSAAADLLGDAVKQVEASIGYTLPEANIENVHLVRDVAPTKRMICVSFTLPPAFWYRQRSRREPRGEDGSDYDDVSAEESTDGAEKKSTTMEPPRQRHCAE